MSHHSLVRSFGRIKSRKFSNRKKTIFGEFLPKYELAIPVYSTAIEDKSVEIFKKKSFPAKNFLEIGFGFGDFIFEQAKNNQSENFFGCEPHLNGVVNLLSKLENDPLENLKLSKIDIRLLLPHFESNFFHKIFILFPDPWPKSRHLKRRLINTKFFDEVLAPKLENNGKIIIATDHDEYKTWIFNQIFGSKNFAWTAIDYKNWQEFPEFWIETKYQKKAKEEGRNSILIELVKI